MRASDEEYNFNIWQCSAIYPHSLGGVETQISAVSRELKNLGFPVHIGMDFPEHWFNDNLSKKILHTHGNFFLEPSWILKIKKIPNLKWIHIIHGTTPGRMIACREFYSLSGYKGILKDFIPAKFADAAICVGKQAQIEAKKYFFLNIPSEIIANAADENIFRPLAAITQKPILIFVGRSNDRVKNTATLISACEYLYNWHPDLELWAAPGITNFDHNNSNSKPYFLKNLGPLQSEALQEKLSQSKALILCSFYEGDPIVIHEAKALGVPIIASDLPQLRFALNNYENKFWINPHDQSSLQTMIQKVLYEIKDLRPSPECRSWKKTTNEYVDFYKKIFSMK